MIYCVLVLAVTCNELPADQPQQRCLQRQQVAYVSSTDHPAITGFTQHTDLHCQLCCVAGMCVARLNMSHGNHDSHRDVIDLVREYNASGRGCISTMLDTKVGTVVQTYLHVSPNLWYYGGTMSHALGIGPVLITITSVLCWATCRKTSC